MENKGSERNGRWLLVLALVVVLAALMLAVYSLMRTSVPAAIRIVPPAPTPTSIPTATPSPLVVHVTGAVNQPGVVTVPAGSRVQDAVDAAGGLDEEADEFAINMADLLLDGQQIYVPVEGEIIPPMRAPANIDPGIVVININTATAEELQTLPGVGETIAGRIVSYREENGPFESIEELMDVTGIGEIKFADCQGLITVGR